MPSSQEQAASKMDTQKNWIMKWEGDELSKQVEQKAENKLGPKDQVKATQEAEEEIQNQAQIEELDTAYNDMMKAETRLQDSQKQLEYAQPIKDKRLIKKAEKKLKENQTLKDLATARYKAYEKLNKAANNQNKLGQELGQQIDTINASDQNRKNADKMVREIEKAYNDARSIADQKNKAYIEQEKKSSEADKQYDQEKQKLDEQRKKEEQNIQDKQKQKEEKNKLKQSKKTPIEMQPTKTESQNETKW